MSKITRDTASKAINPHLLSLTKLPKTLNSDIVPARSIAFNPGRFDIAAKLAFAHYYSLGVKSPWLDNFLRDQVKIMTSGTFKEGDGQGKTSYEDFKISFVKLLRSMKKNGFDSGKGLIPLNKDGWIVDGAHRLAAAAFYNNNIETVRPIGQSFVYSEAFFIDNGFDENWLNLTRQAFCRYNPKAQLIFVFPCANGKEEDIVKIINKYGEVFSRTKVNLKNNGPTLLMKELYSEEDWADAATAKERARRSWNGKGSLRIYAISSDSTEKQQRHMKQALRKLFALGNISVHTTDSQAEALRIGKIIYSKPSIHMLNHAHLQSFNRYKPLFSLYRKNILALPESSQEKYAIDGSSVLAAYGLRDVNDIDYLTTARDDQLDDLGDKFENHKKNAQHYSNKLNDLVTNPLETFYVDGCKFVSLSRTAEMKKTRNDTKDRGDIARIRTVSSPILGVFLWKARRIASFSKRALARARNAIQMLIKNPHSFYDKVRGAPVMSMTYKGFDLFYSRGTSSIGRIKREGDYEADNQRLLIDILPEKNGLMIDIGANIGLISLGILETKPTTTIHAFEPGPHQHSLLSRTIESNHLEKTIKLYDIGMSDKDSFSAFVVHNTADVSGDGFMDTGRAGPARDHITVQTMKLDTWWKNNKKPSVDLIKIDTEGSEFDIFKGGEKLLSLLHPALLFEMNSQNLEAYPHSANDIIALLHSYGYETWTKSGGPLTQDNVAIKMIHDEEFIAKKAIK